jgi:hypothetical protein
VAILNETEVARQASAKHLIEESPLVEAVQNRFQHVIPHSTHGGGHDRRSVPLRNIGFVDLRRGANRP